MKKKTKIGKKLLNNWALKLFSLVAAFLLWLLVMNIEDPEDQKPFYNIPVKLINTDELTDEGKVYEILDKTDIVSRVTVTAPKSIRDELSASDIVAEADFGKLTYTGTVEITFYSLRYNDKISDISGSNEILKLNIEDKKTKRIELEVETAGEVADGYIINGATPDQNRIEISGPASVISRIATATAKVDVTGSTSDISTYADVKLYDADKKEISTENLTINIKSVRVRVEILATKSVPITYSVMGTPAAGYLFTGEIASTPESVRLAGTAEALNRINEIVIPEEALNITGQAENMITSIDIEDYLPESVFLSDSSFRGKAVVTVYIEKEAQKNLNIAPERVRITGMPAGYTAELEGDDTAYILNVRGLGAEVEALDEKSLYGHINIADFMQDRNLDSLEPGIYEMEAEFTLSENVTVVQPLKVLVRITKMEES